MRSGRCALLSYGVRDEEVCSDGRKPLSLMLKTALSQNGLSHVCVYVCMYVCMYVCIIAYYLYIYALDENTHTHTLVQKHGLCFAP